jgi:hypothetical protein
MDKFLTAREWHWNGAEFVTVRDGLGFAVTLKDGHMILAGMSQDARAKATLVYNKHDTTGWGALGLVGGSRLVTHLFEIPASAEVVSAAVSSAFNVRF